MEKQNKILAVIWDFDGTIADSRQRNYNVTLKIVETILGKKPNSFPVLSSLDSYFTAHTQTFNWREFYHDNFNLEEEQVDRAGALWTEYQLKDQTPIPLIDGVKEVMEHLSIYPQAIVSQNSRDNIVKYLKEKGIHHYIQDVIGYEEVHIARQKPLPDGLITCINTLTDSQSGLVFFIGDHKTDVQCVQNANEVLTKNSRNIKIICLGAFYGIDVDTSDWEFLPDFEIMDAGTIPDIINRFLIND